MIEHTRRPVLAAATLTTAAALALTPIAVSPPAMHMPNVSSAISTQAVNLSDYWSDLATYTAKSLTTLGELYVGTGSVPLPSPTIFVAPIITQLVLNQLIYAGQLFSGQGSQIPGEISNHLTRVASVFGEISSALPGLIGGQLQTPVIAIQQAIKLISISTNPLVGLIQAPALFLDVMLNGDYGLLGPQGPISVGIVIRNALATAVDPPLPSWLSNILHPKVPGAAALTPKSTTVALKVPAAAHSAPSSRSGSKAAAGNSKTAAAKSSSSTGSGHSKRG